MQRKRKHTVAKRTLRRMAPTAREIAKFANELSRIASRLHGKIVDDVMTAEMDARAFHNRNGHEAARAQDYAAPHDPADCDELVCGRCNDYMDGYAAGKGKAHFELRHWEPGAHAADCGCEVCQTVRKVLETAAAAG